MAGDTRLKRRAPVALRDFSRNSNTVEIWCDRRDYLTKSTSSRIMIPG